MVLICVSLISDVESLLVFAICMTALEKCIFGSLLPHLSLVVFFLLLNCTGSLIGV